MSTLFMKASCGCIVLAGEHGGQRLVVRQCDGDRYAPSIGFFLRDLSDKTFGY